MMIRLLFYLLVSLCVLQEGIGAEPSPVVVLPANFRWGAQNEILVSPIRTMDPNTTFLTIISLDIRTADSKRTVFSKNILQLSNKPKIIKFPLSQEEKYASAYKVSIKADGHDAFEKVVYGTPDIRSIEIQTDKVFYKKGETVKVRALPITERGEIYRGPISFNLWNPHNFKLTNKTGWAEDRYIGLEFELPEELQYGEWKVVAVPYDNLGQEVSEKSMAYAAAFEVQDYVLPLIQVLIDAKVTKDSEIPLFTVCAQYSHGTRLNGSVKIECRSAGFAENRYLTHLTMMNGIVASQVKVSECFPDKHTTSTTIIAKVRDESTSATAETRYELDIRVAGFDLVPLRPAFSSRTLDFYVYVKPTGSSFEDLPDVVHMNVTCLADRSNKVTSYKAKIGEILPINGDWSSFYECSAIVIFAQRAISDVMLSRNVTLIIGNMSTSSTTNFNLINPENPTKKGYKVGEEFRATVSEAAAEYMVICNMRDVAAHGQVAQQTIRFTVTEKMIPQCVLYVYTFNKDKPSTDMWLFFVENVCPYTANANASEISPSDKLRIDVTGPKNGLALLHIVDSRMFGLLERVLMYGPSTYWEMDSFGTEIPSRLRLSNFIDDADFRFHLGKTCREAGFYYKRHSSAPCPSAGRSSSGISNYCQQLLTKSCLSDAPRPYDGPVEALLQRPTTKTKVTSSSAVSFDIRAPQSPTIIRSQVVQDDDTIPKGVVTDLVKVRQHFPEVWLFNDLALDSSGKGQTVLTSPDSIANWSLASSFWGPGHHSVCRPAPSTVISKKDFYMTVELPKHIYMNETITAEIIVTTEVPLSEYLDLSVCISGLAYQACIDQGPRGELGQEIYNQVRLTKSTSSGVRKTPIFFTRPGKVDLVFTLRRQYNITFHHCKEGKIEDMVKVTVNVEKRADTELSYKGIIISPDKPLKEETKTRSTERIDYDQIRNGKQVTTNIHINLMESEAQALALEISKFLPTAPFNVPKAFRDEKRKLGVLPTKKLFLSDILREFSVKLYKLKAIELNPKKSLTEIEESMDLKGEIVQLVSAMSTFTNCTSDGSHCGYGEYGTPQRDNDISIPLTAVSSMLLCQWGADSSMTRGPVQLLFRSVRGVIDEDREVDDILQDLPRATDRIALLQALLYQVGVDCKGVFDEAHDNPRRNKELIINQKELTRRLFFIDNLGRLDPRVIASLGSMSLLVIHDQARLMLNRSIRRNQIPFWEFNETCQAGPCEENLPNDVKQFIRFQDEKRNAVLLNSLGLLAYAEKGIINKSGGNTNLDHLADWIFEQKRDDEAYFGVLDTFFASRALYVYRKNHNSSAFSGDTKLNIRYMHDDKLVDDEVILDDNALLVPLPANVSALNIVSSGDGKVKLGVQLVTSKRQRSKRNTPDDFFPVKITCNQQTIGDSNLIQEVCIQVKSRFLKTLQIDHALYTGFKSSPAQFQLKTKSGARIIGEVEFSDYGAHAIFTNLSPDEPTCYAIGMNNFVREPNGLAPVLISALSTDKGVVGQLYVSHPDVNESMRRRRQTSPFEVDGAIDKICFQGGECSCAEANCGVKCNQCKGMDTQKILAADDAMACNLQVSGKPYWYNTSLVTTSNYIVVPLSDMLTTPPKNITLWIRACNWRCHGDGDIEKYFAEDQWFILLGNKHASVVDSQQRRHYILNNSDYFDKAEANCDSAVANITRARKCHFA